LKELIERGALFANYRKRVAIDFGISVSCAEDNILLGCRQNVPSIEICLDDGSFAAVFKPLGIRASPDASLVKQVSEDSL